MSELVLGSELGEHTRRLLVSDAMSHNSLMVTLGDHFIIWHF